MDIIENLTKQDEDRACRLKGLWGDSMLTI